MSLLKKTLGAIIVVGLMASPWTLSVAADGPKIESKIDFESGGALGADIDWGDMGQNFPDLNRQPMELPDFPPPNESSPGDSCIGPACPGGMEIPGT